MKAPTAKDYFLCGSITLIGSVVTSWSPTRVYPLSVGLLIPALIALTVTPPWRAPTLLGVWATTLALAGLNAGRMGTPWLVLLAWGVCGAVLIAAGWTKSKGEGTEAAPAKALLVLAAIFAILLVPYLWLEG